MQQITVVQSPASPPSPPSPTAAPSPTVVFSRSITGAPVTPREVEALLARKEVLSNQLTSAVGRRKDLARQIMATSGQDKAGLEQRLGVLDGRIARLEQEIDENGRLLSSAPAALITSQRGDLPGWGTNVPNQLERNVTPIVIVFILFVLCPIALSISRIFWKRGSLPPRAGAAADRETSHRLERMEQSMEAIAIEIERISEGQRFVTRLMADGKPGALGAGGSLMEPVRAQVGEKVRV